MATPALEQLAAQQSALHAAEGPGDYVFALHALWEHFGPLWQDGKALIKTVEAIDVFRAAEIEWVADPAKAKGLLRKLGGVNKSTYWNG